MLVPVFNISQDDTSVTLKVYAPNARVKDVVATVVEDLFTFSGVPYYLRIQLPHALQNSEESADACTCSYDCDAAEYTFVCRKRQQGQVFPGLHALQHALRQPEAAPVPRVDVISETTNEDDDESEEDENESHYPPITPNSTLEDSTVPKYGFGNRFCNVENINERLYDVVQLPAANTTPAAQRPALREAEEVAAFSWEHYLADLHNPQDWAPAAAFCPHWRSQPAVALSHGEQQSLAALTASALPLLSEEHTRAELVSVTSLLLAYCHTHRATLGHPHPATLTALCPPLAWLDPPLTVPACVRAAVRRALCYALVRSFDFAKTAVADCVALLRKGRAAVLSALLAVHQLYADSADSKLLNALYVSDWVRLAARTDDCRWTLMADDVEKASAELTKEGLGLSIELCERLAREVMEDELTNQAAEGAGRAVLLANHGAGMAGEGADLVPATNQRLEEEHRSANRVASLMSRLCVDDDDSTDSDDDSSDSEDSSDDSSSDDSDDSSSEEESSTEEESSSEDESPDKNVVLPK